jgi:8-oxo-dGTP pyrophosphatase MutT (NUDIX family)
MHDSLAAPRTGAASLAAVTREEVAQALMGDYGSDKRGDLDLNPDVRLPGLILRPAAVLCPIVEREGVLRVVLTVRSHELKHHAGQIAFPGGKVDAGDPSPLAAALREAREEIGLTADLIDVAGRLPPYETGTGFRISPFVGLVDRAFRAIPEAGEVAEVFEPPLDFVLDPGNRRIGSREWKGALRRFYEIPWGDYYIWGATAGMLKMLSDRVLALRADASAPSPAQPTVPPREA